MPLHPTSKVLYFTQLLYVLIMNYAVAESAAVVYVSTSDVSSLVLIVSVASAYFGLVVFF